MSTVYRFDDYIFDSVARQFFRSGENVHLTSRLADVLDLLLKRNGEVVSKDELISMIWHDQIVEENNLTVCIWELRRILSEKSPGRKYVETVPKRGYRFTRPVQLVHHPADTQQIPGSVTPKWMQATSEAQALAVLPFINDTGHSKLDYVSDGLTETLISSVSRATGLKVIAYHVIIRYKSSSRDVLDIARELNANLVLVGRLTVRGRFYLSIELIDVKSGFQLAGKSLELEPSDLLRTQNDILVHIGEAIPPLRPDRGTTITHTTNSDAYRLYLKGRYFLSNKSVTATRQAIKYFERAVRHDPRFTLAYAGLADCYSRLSTYGVYPPRIAFPKAKQLIQKALEIDDKLPEAHASLARIRVNYDWDWPGAESEFRRAIDLNPGYAPGYQLYAEHMARIGAFDEALEIAGKAVNIDPLDRSLIRTTGMILYLARRYDEAAESCAELLEMDPGNLPAVALLAAIYAAQEKFDLAISLLQQIVETAARNESVSVSGEGSSTKRITTRPAQSVLEIVGALGYVYGRSGKRRKAQKLLRELESYSRDLYVEPHALAMINIGLSDYDEAFTWLAKSREERSFILTFLKVWPFFDPIRSDPRFDELVENVRFG